MSKYLINLEVELKEGFNEEEIDRAISDTISKLGGEVIDSKPYVEID